MCAAKAKNGGKFRNPKSPTAARWAGLERRFKTPHRQRQGHAAAAGPRATGRTLRASPPPQGGIRFRTAADTDLRPSVPSRAYTHARGAREAARDGLCASVGRLRLPRGRPATRGRQARAARPLRRCTPEPVVGRRRCPPRTGRARACCCWRRRGDGRCGRR
jgi:hypothetical protein